MAILKSHPCEGVDATTVNAATEGWSSSIGTLPVYDVDAGVWNGTSSVLFASNGGARSLEDNGLAAGALPYFGWWMTTANRTGLCNFTEVRAFDGAGGSLAVLQMQISGTVELKTGSGATQQTTVTALTGPGYWLEWHVTTAGTQELRIYAASNLATPLETVSVAASTGTADIFRLGQTNATNDLADVWYDQVVLADSWVALHAVVERSGTAGGAYTFTGTAAGTAPAAGPNSGTAAGSYSFAGSATGSAVHSGVTSGGYEFAGSATGGAVHQGAAAGGYNFTGTATGGQPIVPRDITILSTTEPVIAWEANEPTVSWLAAEPSPPTITATEPASAWVATEPKE